ncbi:unnamed protein product [Anisakis simplex]|uniref:Extradiol dioxygenase n=1 Tax=Anisakis simplex TaxID=6269 RepID=A0A0M3JJG4_ANISI|nr:unnamed protein product [Anisakis simplex]
MVGVQLLVHREDVENARSWKFGVTGPVHEIIREAPDRYAAFIGEPTIQFVESDLFASEMDQWAVPVPAEVSKTLWYFHSLSVTEE